MEIVEKRNLELELRATYTEDGKVVGRIAAHAPYEEGSQRTATVTQHFELPELAAPMKKVLEQHAQEVGREAIKAAEQARREALSRRESTKK